MLPPSVLLTGVSGYLGGTILAQLAANPTLLLPRSNSNYNKIYALVRTDDQADAVVEQQRQYTEANIDVEVEPIRFDHKNEAEAKRVLLEKGITVVFYLIDAARSEGQAALIKALAAVRRERGLKEGDDVHFLHTTGAKMFSSHTGAPTDRPLLDNDPHLYEIQKAQKATVGVMQGALDTNNTVIELCEEHGVKPYIFAPCIVYGKGEGIRSNPISIQTKAIVEAAKGVGRVYSVDEGEPTWPVCHVADTATLYLRLLNLILLSSNSGSNSHPPPPSGKQGYYLASPGSVKWIDLYRAMAKALHAEGVVDTPDVAPADNKILAEMGAALKCPPEIVPVQLGGKCTFEARRGREIGWTPKYEATHAIESAADEVRLILANL